MEENQNDNKGNESMDIYKMLEMAQTLNQIMNTNNTDENKKQNENQNKNQSENQSKNQCTNQYNSQNCKSSAETKETRKEEFKNIGYHNYIPIVFDEKLHTPEMKAIKSAIPYLQPYNRKKVGLLVKFWEIQKLIQSDEDLQTSTQNTKKITNDSMREMLKAMRPHFEDKRQQMIDMVIKMIEIKTIMEKIQNNY